MRATDIISIAVTRATRYPSQAGFNVGLLVALTSVVAARLSGPYKNIQDIEDAGWDSTTLVHHKASQFFGQNPAPDALMIGRRLNSYTQTVRLTPVNTTAGYVHSFTIVLPSGAEHAFSYTNGASETVANICDQIVADIDPLANVSATDGTTHVDIAATAGMSFRLKNLKKPTELDVQDRTTDPGIAADLSAIEAIDDGASWYAVMLDRAGEAEIDAAAAWVQTRKKILSVESTDTDITESGTTTDVMSDLAGAEYTRTFLHYVSNALESGISAAILGRMLPLDPPGSASFAHQNLVGITSDSNTSAIDTAIQNKNGNLYSKIGGSGRTFPGKMANGEFADIIYGQDWLEARLVEACLAAEQSAADLGTKIAYTDAAIEQWLVSAMRGVMVMAERANYITSGWTVTADKVADTILADRSARRYPGLHFAATLAGAVHTAEIEGVLEL